jgi:hypothetical protein
MRDTHRSSSATQRVRMLSLAIRSKGNHERSVVFNYFFSQFCSSVFLDHHHPLLIESMTKKTRGHRHNWKLLMFSFATGGIWVKKVLLLLLCMICSSV